MLLLAVQVLGVSAVFAGAARAQGSLTRLTRAGRPRLSGKTSRETSVMGVGGMCEGEGGLVRWDGWDVYGWLQERRKLD